MIYLARIFPQKVKVKVTGIKIAKIAILKNLAALIILKLKKRLCRKDLATLIILPIVSNPCLPSFSSRASRKYKTT